MALRRTARGPGRPSLLLQLDVEKKLIDATAMGAPMALAAAHVGITPRAFERWLQRGHEEQARREDGEAPDPGEQLYLDFYERIAQARSQAGIRSLAAIQRAAVGGAVTEETTQTMPDGSVVRTVKRTAPDWRAGAWFLERQQRVDFGKQAEVALTGPGGGPVQVEHSVDMDALSQRVHAAVQAALPAGPADPDDDTIDAEVIEHE